LFCQIGGDKIECQPVCLVGGVQPGQEYNWEVEFTAPEAEGAYTSFFRMVAGNNNRFGHKVWISVLVQPEHKIEPKQSFDSMGDKEGDASIQDLPI